MSLVKKPLLLGVLLTGALLLAEARPPLARAQAKETVEIKSSPRFLAAFRDVVGKVSKSTVRIQCGGKDTALGVVVSTDGFILTKHSDLVEPLTVKFANGTELNGKLVGVNPEHDLAMLKVLAGGLTPVTWTDSKVALVGDFVASCGTGSDPVCVGILSVASRKLPKAGFKPSPSSGYLGIGLEDAGKDQGVKVAQVMPGTAAAKANLQVGDIITAVGERPIKDSETLIKTLQKFKPGDKITLKILRDEESKKVEVELGLRPPDRADFQNSLGSELSKRRDGFPTVLQHDSVIRPADCGGPLVDLEGRVIGINIARAGRVESFAIPSEVIQPLLADLMSGKLAPKK
jgi:serine protease Do